MKNIFQNIAKAALLVALAACSENENTVPCIPDTRTITVRGLGTKTTIEYEGSDYSHLTWQEGDKVAYATNLDEDLAQTAIVSQNEYKATIPAAATKANKLVTLWPVANNEGKTSAQMTAELKDEITQNVDLPFDGNLLPMYAVSQIPDGEIVDAKYNTLGAVVRFSIDPKNHEEETLKSITLSANEYLTGSYTLDLGEEVSWNFTGESNTVQTHIEGEAENLLLNNNKLYVYMVVNPNQYTGVRIVIETDANVYEFNDGVMNLDQENKTLYRIHLNLDNSGVVPPSPQERYFVPVQDIAEITPDGSYLIVTDNTEAIHYTPGNAAKSEIEYLEPVEVTVTENGIVKTDEIMNLTWKIEFDGEAYTLFSTKHNKYVQAPGAISTRVYGHIWLEASIENANYDHTHFDIHVSGKQTEIALRHVDAKLQYFTNTNNQMFCFCKPDATDIGKVQDITIYKLVE